MRGLRSRRKLRSGGYAGRLGALSGRNADVPACGAARGPRAETKRDAKTTAPTPATKDRSNNNTCRPKTTPEVAAIVLRLFPALSILFFLLPSTEPAASAGRCSSLFPRKHPNKNKNKQKKKRKQRGRLTSPAHSPARGGASLVNAYNETRGSRPGGRHRPPSCPDHRIKKPAQMRQKRTHVPTFPTTLRTLVHTRVFGCNRASYNRFSSLLQLPRPPEHQRSRSHKQSREASQSVTKRKSVNQPLTFRRTPSRMFNVPCSEFQRNFLVDEVPQYRTCPSNWALLTLTKLWDGGKITLSNLEACSFLPPYIRQKLNAI